MAQIIRSKFIKPNKPPCGRDCQDRHIGCHSKCAKYIEWKKEYADRKYALKKYISGVAEIEEFEIIQKQKIMKARRRKK